MMKNFEKETLENILVSEDLCNFVFIENSESSIPVEVEVPKKWIFNYPIATLEQAYNIIETELLVIEDFAKNAFFQNKKEYWDKVQNILYLWNLNDISRKEVVDDYKFVVQTVLRNKIIEVEQNSRKMPILECMNDFSPDKAVQELADKAKSHRINNHPLTTELSENGLPLEYVKTFINNYYVNNRLFHLFIATLSLFTPLERRTELANNFYDEMGAGDNSMAHPILFLKNYNTIGKPGKIIPFAESLYLANSKLFAAFLSGNYHYGMGGFGCIEITMPEQMTKILNGLKKSGLPERDLEFWRIHITIDVEHGKTWFREMKELVKTSEEAEHCLQGGMALLEARASLYDGVWNYILSRDKK